MTTDQLERDLKALAEPRDHDDDLRLGIRARLDDQLPGRRASRRRRRFGAGVAAVAMASAAVAVVALVSTTGSGGPSAANAAILAHVVRASSPPANMIVHLRETGLRDAVVVEWWQETNAPYALRMIKGTSGETVESGLDGTRFSQYDPGTNTVYQRPDSKAPTLVDPIETLRAGLVDGTAQITGTVTIDGRSLYEIALPNGVVGYFDKTSYRPVYIDNPQQDGSVVRTQVVAYEELPLTSANERLLDVAAQHPGARVAEGAAPEPNRPATGTK